MGTPEAVDMSRSSRRIVCASQCSLIGQPTSIVSLSSMNNLTAAFEASSLGAHCHQSLRSIQNNPHHHHSNSSTSQQSPHKSSDPSHIQLQALLQVPRLSHSLLTVSSTTDPHRLHSLYATQGLYRLDWVYRFLRPRRRGGVSYAVEE